MLETVTTVPISPTIFWPVVGLAGLMALTALIYWVLGRGKHPYSPPIWEDMPGGWHPAVILLGLLWVGLFGLTIAAAYAGVWQMIFAPGAAASPGLGIGALLAALLGGPFLIWGTVLKHRTVGFQKEGHITDRINKAVEMLGAEKTVKKDGVEETQPNIEVRIGAILSLERIAQDSTAYDKGRDHVRVMEILCAYVRENSPAKGAKNFPLPEWVSLPDGADDAERQEHEAWRAARFVRGEIEGLDGWFKPNAADWADSLPNPRQDIAQVLKVMGRRSVAQRLVEAAWPRTRDDATIWPFDVPCPKWPKKDHQTERTLTEIGAHKSAVYSWRNKLIAYSGYRLDLTGANLQGADLSAKFRDQSDAVFSGALMMRTRLEGARLSSARLEGADLSMARIVGARLLHARLEGAVLEHSRMEVSGLSWARMDGARLRHARMEGANLSWALIEGMILAGREWKGRTSGGRGWKE